MTDSYDVLEIYHIRSMLHLLFSYIIPMPGVGFEPTPVELLRLLPLPIGLPGLFTYIFTNNGVTRLSYENTHYYSERPVYTQHWYSSNGIAIPGSAADTLGISLTNHWNTFRTQEDGLDLIDRFNLPALEQEEE